MRLLTFSSLYPSAARPRHGIFVENRLRRIVAGGDFSASVVAPVPWVPPGLTRLAAYRDLAATPARDIRHGLEVHYPRWPAIPRIGMNLAPLAMARGCGRMVSDIVAENAVDLIDAHYFYPDGVAAARLSEKCGKPLVITARGSDINVIAAFSGPRKKILAAAERAAAIIAVSHALADRMIAIGMPAEKISVLRNGVDLELFSPPPAREATSEMSDPVILCVGNILPEKGQGLLLEALPAIEGNPRLVIVGDGPGRKLLEGRARALGVADRVRFTGTVPHAELPAYYNAASVTVLASASEGMPNVVLESLACGTPVIGTRVGGIPEIIQGDGAGMLLDDRSSAAIADAVNRVLRDPPAAGAARAVAEKFGWDSVIAEQRALYRHVADI